MAHQSPPPFVVQGEWFAVALRGGRPNAKVASVSLAPARATPLEGEDIGEQNPLRDELTVNLVLRSHLFSKARSPAHPSPIGNGGDVRHCLLKEWKPKSPSFDEKGNCSVQVLVEGVGGPFELCCKVDDKQTVYSLPFAVCSRRLAVSSSLSEWESQLEGTEWPKSWLKDMGKKDKTLHFTVSLPQADFAGLGTLPLRAYLVYSDGLVVPNQKLLSIKNHALELTEKKPACTVHFRIEDVSKNHQSKAFMVLVESARGSTQAKPSSSSLLDDVFAIAPACSYPVIVKSKINKKRKSRAQQDDDEDSTVPRGNKQVKTEEPPAPPAELLNVLSVSLSESLVKNSQERSQAEARLSQLVKQMQQVQEEMSEAMSILSSLSQERANLETKFSELIAKCKVVDKAPEPGSLSLASTRETFANEIHQGMSSSNPLNRSFSAGFEGKDLMLGPSTASILFLGSDDASPSSAMLMPSGLVRLQTGELMSLAIKMGEQTASHENGLNDEEEEEDQGEEEEGAESDDTEGPPAVAFIREIPVVMSSGEKRWLCYSKTHDLIGYFVADGAFVDIANVRDQRWKEAHRKVEPDSLSIVEGGVSSDKGMNRIRDIISRLQ